MASKSSKTLPSLSKCKAYEDWLKLIKVWRHFTDLPANRQGSALVLYLEDEAIDAVLEIDDEDILKKMVWMLYLNIKTGYLRKTSQSPNTKL